MPVDLILKLVSLSLDNGGSNCWYGYAMGGGKNKTKNCRFEGVEGREKERIINKEEMKEK